jgi:hypothetical protein
LTARTVDGLRQVLDRSSDQELSGFFNRNAEKLKNPDYPIRSSEFLYEVQNRTYNFEHGRSVGHDYLNMTKGTLQAMLEKYIGDRRVEIVTVRDS